MYLSTDGGVARLRVHGEVKPDWTQVTEEQRLDLLAMINGGVCVEHSDAHYGHARNVIAPGRAKKMNEGNHYSSLTACQWTAAAGAIDASCYQCVPRVVQMLQLHNLLFN